MTCSDHPVPLSFPLLFVVVVVVTSPLGQRAAAYRLYELGTALVLERRNLDPLLVAFATHVLLHHPHVSDQTLRVAQTVRGAGGTAAAASAVELQFALLQHHASTILSPRSAPPSAAPTTAINSMTGRPALSDLYAPPASPYGPAVPWSTVGMAGAAVDSDPASSPEYLILPDHAWPWYKRYVTT